MPLSPPTQLPAFVGIGSFWKPHAPLLFKYGDVPFRLCLVHGRSAGGPPRFFLSRLCTSRQECGVSCCTTRTRFRPRNRRFGFDTYTPQGGTFLPQPYGRIRTHPFLGKLLCRCTACQPPQMSPILVCGILEKITWRQPTLCLTVIPSLLPVVPWQGPSSHQVISYGAPALERDSAGDTVSRASTLGGR